MDQDHPAVSRPGRAAATIEFVPLPGEEAAQWLRARRSGSEAIPDGHATLAELFAHAAGTSTLRTTRRIGFEA